MVDEPVGDSMELREVGKGRSFHLLGGQVRFGEVRCTFAAQRIDAGLFHFQMEQESIGARAIPKGL